MQFQPYEVFHRNTFAVPWPVSYGGSKNGAYPSKYIYLLCIVFHKGNNLPIEKSYMYSNGQICCYTRNGLKFGCFVGFFQLPKILPTEKLNWWMGLLTSIKMWNGLEIFGCFCHYCVIITIVQCAYTCLLQSFV